METFMKLLGKILLIAGLFICNVAFSATIVDKNIITYTNKIYIVLTPTDTTQAVNKAYVDNTTNFIQVAIHGSSPNIRQTDSSTNFLSLWGGDGTGSRLQLYAPLGGYSNGILATCNTWFWFMPDWVPNLQTPDKAFNLSGGKIAGGTVSNCTIDPSCTYNGSAALLTNNAFSWSMSDPAPISTSVNSSNVWVIGQFPVNVQITNKADGASSGTGVYDIVEYTATNNLDFAGILVYTGLVSTLTGDSSARTINLTAGKLYGMKLTNAVGLNGWHVQLMGQTK
jgi:hypothetical protein